MFRNKIVRWSTIAMLVAILAYFFIETFQTAPVAEGAIVMEKLADEEFAAQMKEQREEKEIFFRTSPESPIENKANFKGLTYFAPDQNFRVLANLTPYEGEEKEMKVAYTDSTTDTYERLYFADFTINGVAQRLLLLKNEGTISVLFRDQTSGLQSYGGGRYIDIALDDVKGNTLIIDFNKSYSPYCAYSPGYACPLPPAENTLTVAIEAGEKYEEEKR